MGSSTITNVARAAVGRVFATCLAALVVIATVMAGRSYLWCSMMERPVEACCCEPERDALQAPTDTAPELRSGCCEGRGHDELTKGRVSPASGEIPRATAGTAAVLPAAPSSTTARDVSSRRVEPGPRTSFGLIRAGPRSAQETCAFLRVFRC